MMSESEKLARRALFSPSEAAQPKVSSEHLLAIAQAITPKALALTILPTEKCNFRCTYCYETFDLGRMSNETVQSIKNLIGMRVHDLDHLTLSWFGGEPLAAPDIILDISQYAQDLCRDNDVIFHSGDITTNGSLLTKSLLDGLVARNQTRFQISLDGWKAGHDRTRRSGDGGGTFDDVWGSLLMLKKSAHPVHVTVRIHLMPENLDSVLELAEHLRDEIAGDARFSIFLKAIENLGGPYASQIKPLGREARAEITSKLKSVLGGMPGVSADELQDSGSYVCYASKPNSLIVRANGRLAKCTVAFADARNDVGWIRQDGTIEVENSKLSYWFRGLYSRDKGILACPLVVYPHESGLSSKKVIKIAVD